MDSPDPKDTKGKKKQKMFEDRPAFEVYNEKFNKSWMSDEMVKQFNANIFKGFFNDEENKRNIVVTLT